MVFSCIVPDCTSRKGEVTFHRLPKNNSRRHQWLRNARIKKNTSKSLFICSLHFRETDYFPVQKGKKKSYLKLNALPSLFSWTNQTSKSLNTCESKLETIKKNEESIQKCDLVGSVNQKENTTSVVNKKSTDKETNKFNSYSTSIADVSETESESDSNASYVANQEFPPIYNNIPTSVIDSSETDSTTSEESIKELPSDDTPWKRLPCEPTGDVLLDMALTPVLGWSIERRINEVVFSKIRNNYVIMSCTFDQDMLYKINVLNYEAPMFLIDDLMNIALEETLDITTLIKKLDTWNVCEGNTDEIFVENFFYKEIQCKGRLCQKTDSIYSLDCELVCKAERCNPCFEYRSHLINSFLMSNDHQEIKA